MQALTPSRSIARRLVPWTALVIIISSALLGSFAIKVFDDAVEPELNRRTQLIGSMVRSNVQLALDSGIPMEGLTGVDDYLRKVLGAFQEVESLAILTVENVVVSEVRRDDDPRGVGPSIGEANLLPDVRRYELHRFVLPVLDGNSLAGRILVDVDQRYISTQFRNIFLDIAVVVIVTILLAFEIMLTIVSRSFVKPLDRLVELLRQQAGGDFSMRIHTGATGALIERISERFSDHAADMNARYLRLRERFATPSQEARVLESMKHRFVLGAEGPSILSWRATVDIRFPLFLFLIAEELSKPFLPLYIKARIGPEGWFGEDLLISLPLVAYLLSIAVLSPFARSLIHRIGSRRVFLIALAPVIASHVGLGLSETVSEIVFWRGLVGAAYALATIACQDYALSSVEGRQPGRAMGGFIAVVIGGTFCGTALGGILADRIGQSNVFFASAIVVALAGVMAMRVLGQDNAVRSEPPRFSVWRELWRPFQSRRILTLFLGVSVPSSALVAAFLWYLVPLLLSDLGVSTSDTGRVMMLYYLSIILLGPFVATKASSYGTTLSLLFLGSILSGSALLAVAGAVSLWNVALAVLACGVAHSLVRAPLMTLSLKIADEECDTSAKQALLGTLQTVERLGSTAGLLGIAYLAGQIGFEVALGVTGVLVLVGALGFAILEAACLLARRNRA